ncbi:hypothetical protein RCL1_000912 [Eukaryota sp. TZLM3-RCL]
MRYSLRDVLIYTVSAILFIGFVYLVQKFILFDVLAQTFFTDHLLFWHSGLTIMLFLSYGLIILPIVYLSYTTIMVSVYFTVSTTAVLFTDAFVDATLLLLLGSIVVYLFKLNMRCPALHDIVIFYVFIVIYTFISYCSSALIRVIFGTPFPGFFPSALRSITAAIFSLALLGPFLMGVVVPLVDHVYLYHLNFGKRTIRRFTQEHPHLCFICRPPHHLLLLFLLILFTLSVMVFLFWISSFGWQVSWYVLSLFLSFPFIFGGYFITTFFGFAFFLSLVFSIAIFGIIPTRPISLTLFIGAASMLVLFAAMYSDEVKAQKRRSVAELESIVNERTKSLHESEQQLVSSLDSKRYFISQVSHDLITPVHQASASLSNLSTIQMNSEQLKALSATRLSHFFLAKHVDDLIVESSLDRKDEVVLSSNTIHSVVETVAAEYAEWGLQVIYFEKDNVDTLSLVMLPLFRFSKVVELILRVFSTSYSEENQREGDLSFAHITGTFDINNTVLFKLNFSLNFSQIIIDSNRRLLNFTELLSPDKNMLLAQLLDVTDLVLTVSSRDAVLAGEFAIDKTLSVSHELQFLKDLFDSFSVISSLESVETYISSILSLVLNRKTDLLSGTDRHLFIIDQVFPTVFDESLVMKSETVKVVRILSNRKLGFLSHPVTSFQLVHSLKELFVTRSEVKAVDYPQVLVVDDSKMNVTLLQGMLKKLDVLSDAAFDGEQAIEVFGERLRDDSKDSYKLVIMDILMPKLDGIEATIAIRSIEKSRSLEVKRRTVVVALSAHALQDERLLKDMNMAGFDLMLKKPITLSQLRHVVELSRVYVKEI